MIKNVAERREMLKMKTISKKKKKIILIVAIALTAIFAALSYILIWQPDLFAEKKKGPSNMYSDDLISYLFYPADYELDVTTVPEYMEKDRYIHYINGGENVAITDENYNSYGSVIRFFRQYFNTIIKGDYETYNEKYFTDRYYTFYEPYYSFAPQMLYDIKVELLSSTKQDDGSIRHAYDVSYKIYKNNGTFRNDIDSDAEKVLYYEIVENGFSVKIDYITYYKKK